MSRDIKNGLLSGSALAIIALTFSAPASAQSACSPSSPNDEDIVTCSGVGTGIVDGGLDDATITVDSTGVIDGGASQAFEFDDGVTFSNTGTLTSSGDHAVQGDNDVSVNNTGTITSTGGDGVNIDKNGSLVNSGSITGEDGAQFEGGSSVVNNEGASITGTKGDAVKIDGEGTVENAGNLTGEDEGIQIEGNGTVTNAAGGSVTGNGGDGVKIEGDGTVENSGAIIGQGDADSDGVQIEGTATITNNATGTILAVGKEGINANTDNATVTNHGTVTATDDAINVARNATIINTGTIISNGGDQDGIDLDSGSIVNSGTITAIGTQDGIDFDPSPDSSTVTNSGTITGNIGINTDPADTGEQTIINSGTITGNGGTALALGQGDDALSILPTSVINGVVDLGTGTDTFIVSIPMNSLTVFTSAPEVTNITGPSIISGGAAVPKMAALAVVAPTQTTIVTYDPASLSVADRLGSELGFGVLGASLGHKKAQGFWATGFGGFGEVSAPGLLSGFDMSHGGGLIGYDFAFGNGAVGAFAGYGQGKADFDNSLYDVTQSLWFGGVRGIFMPTQRITISGSIFGGAGPTDVSTPMLTDFGTDSVFFGAGLRSDIVLIAPDIQKPGLDLVFEAGLLSQSIDSYSITSLGTVIDDRNVTSGKARVELGLPFPISPEFTVRPFIGASVEGSSDDAITATAFGSTTSFSPVDWNDRVAGIAGFSANADFGGATLRAQAEIAFDDRDDTSFNGSLKLTVPFGGN